MIERDESDDAELREAVREVLRIYGLGYTGNEMKEHLKRDMDRLRSALDKREQ